MKDICVFQDLTACHLPYLAPLALFSPAAILQQSQVPSRFFGQKGFFHILTKIMSMRCWQETEQIGSRRKMPFDPQKRPIFCLTRRPLELASSNVSHVSSTPLCKMHHPCVSIQVLQIQTLRQVFMESNYKEVLLGGTN